MAKDKKRNLPLTGLYKKTEDLEKELPNPVASCPRFVFNDVKKGKSKHGHFIVRNVGGPYDNLEINIISKDPFIIITKKSSVHEDQKEKLPLAIHFEAEASEWSKKYFGVISIKLDDSQENVAVYLDTQTKPVNDFAGVFKPLEARKITAIIRRLEKLTSAEMAVVTTESVEGDTIEKYSNNLFNEWGIGKENKNNGILFLIDTDDNLYRIEVGLGLEEIINQEFIRELFEKYVNSNFKAKKFGTGVIKTLTSLSAKIIKEYDVNSSTVK